MIFTSDCMCCLIKREFDDIKNFSDTQRKKEFFKEILSEVQNAPKGENAPAVYGKMCRIREKYFGPVYDYSAEKDKYNKMILKLESRLSESLISQDDPLLYALKLSRAGNYIDFGALPCVDDDYLFSLLTQCGETNISNEEYESFKTDLKCAKTLTLLCDNCGEIVCDKILLKTIRAIFPDISFYAMVRGEAALNDAIMEDAKFVGLDEIAQIVDNGTNVAGTPLQSMPKEAVDIIKNSDVIISKGQANFETLFGCGLNVYYIFLLKCDLFSEIFGLPKFTGMFINDKNVHVPEEYLS